MMLANYSNYRDQVNVTNETLASERDVFDAFSQDKTKNEN